MFFLFVFQSFTGVLLKAFGLLFTGLRKTNFVQICDLYRLLLEDVMFFLFVFQSFTRLLLKASGFLFTGLPFSTHILKAFGFLFTRLRKTNFVQVCELYRFLLEDVMFFPLCFSKLHRSLA